MSRGGANSLRTLVLAPHGRDAIVAERLLTEIDVPVVVCQTIEDLTKGIDDGAGLVVVVEEALKGAGLTTISKWSATQPAWSDLPFVVLSLRSSASEHPNSMQLAELLGNVSFIERPFARRL